MSSYSKSSPSERIARKLPTFIQRAIRAAKTIVGIPDPLYDWYGLSCPCKLPAGDCTIHRRARPMQRPPEGSWRIWGYVAGRGTGKTDAGSCWLHDRVERGIMRRGLLIAPTAADIRDTMVEGPSGLLATAHPKRMPKWESSKRRVVWPNGAVAICISGEEPERARGHNVDTIWADELAAWQHAEKTWKLAMLCLRKGLNPQALFTTTPKRILLKERRSDGIVDLLNWIFKSPGTKLTTETTFANRIHLAEGFIEGIVSLYENTRLGKQEIYAELLDLVDAVWFASFDRKKHVDAKHGEYIEGLPVHLAIDCGTSRWSGAVWFQVKPIGDHHRRVNVFGDFLSGGSYSRQNAEAIWRKSLELPCKGRVDVVRLDPASQARTGIGIAAHHEYEAVFGARLVGMWPMHRVADGLDFMELLLDRGLLAIHPRCDDTIAAFSNYERDERGGIIMEEPKKNQHPHGDMMDALRGGIRDAFPEGRKPELDVTWKHVGQVF